MSRQPDGPARFPGAAPRIEPVHDGRAFLAGLALGVALTLATPAAVLALRTARRGAQLRRAREVLAEYDLPAWP